MKKEVIGKTARAHVMFIDCFAFLFEKTTCISYALLQWHAEWKTKASRDFLDQFTFRITADFLCSTSHPWKLRHLHLYCLKSVRKQLALLFWKKQIWQKVGLFFSMPLNIPLPPILKMFPKLYNSWGILSKEASQFYPVHFLKAFKITLLCLFGLKSSLARYYCCWHWTELEAPFSALSWLPRKNQPSIALETLAVKRCNISRSFEKLIASFDYFCQQNILA